MPDIVVGHRSSLYNFKNITTVPNAVDFIDVTLSKTQRKTPTIVHPSYNVARIRDFYLRKIKHTQTNFHDRLQLMLEQFPKLQDIHPFYSDLMNVLYDRDHYKVAMGDINKAKALIDNVCRDYCRLMKYGDSLYRCKQLKRAALGRMATIIKSKKQTLEYLEEVRKHLSRLPSIDPNTRTIILCGFPNVGKSSFMNSLSRADVEVQPYAFTTKSLYVGHFDYEYQPWQVIDTPGILDKPLEERNTIEMLSVTALAHLNAAVVYVMDISGQCGYSLEEQIKLFHSMKPLFKKNPIRLMLNKCDIVTLEELSADQREMLEAFCQPKDFNEKTIPLHSCSTVTKDGLIDLKNAICNDLLSKRVHEKLKNTKGEAKTALMDRLHVAQPVKRDEVLRPVFVPANFRRKEKMITDSKVVLGPTPKQQFKPQEKVVQTEADLYNEFTDDYVLQIQKHWDLPKPDQKWDTIPEIWNGKNIADYIDPEIEQKVAALLAEEEAREEAGFYDIDHSDDDTDMAELRKLGKHIRGVKKVHMQKAHRERRIQAPQLNRMGRSAGRVVDMKARMEKLGLELDHWDGKADDMDDGEVATHIEAEARGRALLKRARSRSTGELLAAEKDKKMARTASVVPRDKSGMRDESQVKEAARKREKSKVKLHYDHHVARAGEADRHIFDMKPKHLFSGKLGRGKTDRR